MMITFAEGIPLCILRFLDIQGYGWLLPIDKFIFPHFHLIFLNHKILCYVHV